MNLSQREWDLRAKLRAIEAELAAAKRHERDNPGAVFRVERKLRKVKTELANVAQQRDEHRARNRRKREKLYADPERRAAKMKRRAERELAKADTLKRSAPIPKRNAARYAKMRELQFSVSDGYHAYIVGLPCIRCGRPGPGDPMHMLGVDLGGRAEHLLPGCRECHSWQETHKLQFADEFEQRHGLTPIAMAAALRAAYLVERGQQ